MPVICPTITVENIADYRLQMERIASFAHRIHIDFMDGHFAPSKSPEVATAWWPVGVRADFHIMYKDPTAAVKAAVKHRPYLVILHAESDGDFMAMADYCHRHSVKVGVALLQKTPAETILPALPHIDHVLIFSGILGSQGGSHADFSLLEKAQLIKSHKPSIEIGWDGSVSDQNVAQLINGGVDVLNVGGYIQKADDPAKAFRFLERIADETGTT